MGTLDAIFNKSIYNTSRHVFTAYSASTSPTWQWKWLCVVYTCK